jgi:hypothetical protein
VRIGRRDVVDRLLEPPAYEHRESGQDGKGSSSEKEDATIEMAGELHQWTNGEAGEPDAEGLPHLSTGARLTCNRVCPTARTFGG